MYTTLIVGGGGWLSFKLIDNLKARPLGWWGWGGLNSNKVSCGIHYFKVLVQIHYSVLQREKSLNAILMTLKLIYQIKATEGITGLMTQES